jgi:peroxiredoxin
MRLALRSAAGVVLAALLAAVALEVRADDGQYKVGDAVAPFSAVDLAGKPVGTNDLKGQVVFLAFIASKPACVAELPHIDKDVYEPYKDRGLAVVGITQDEAEVARKFKERHGIQYPIWRDHDGRIFDKFVDLKVPWYAVVDRDGKLRYTHQGFEKGALKKLLDDLLKK